MHCEEPLNMDGNAKMTGLFLIDGTRIIIFDKFNLSSTEGRSKR